MDPLIQFNDLQYQYAIKLPKVGSVDADSFSYGGFGLAYNPVNDSLFVEGFELAGKVAEISIPPTAGTATVLQALAAVTEGRLPSVNPGDPNGSRIGGLLPWGSRLIISAYAYYDGSSTQVLSHFASGLPLATPGDLQGPLQVGVPPVKAGYVSGYMGVIPTIWQSAFGGKAFTGNGGLAVVGRTSQGPAVCAFDPDLLGSTIPCPAAPLLYYDPLHPLGPWNSVSQLYNGTAKIKGVVMPEGFRSVLFFGRIGSTFCYGPGTTNQALVGTIGAGFVDPYCYDLEDQSKGTHGYPYHYYIWAYDANDLAAVHAGVKQPWEPRPYAVWPITFPTASAVHYLNGAAYDPATGRLFLAQGQADGNRPIIHVYLIAGGAPAPPPSPVSVVTSAFLDGIVGVPYSAPLQAANGTPPYVWEATGLPPGLSVSGAAIVGTPTLAGTSAVTITVTDADLDTDPATVSLMIAAAPVPPPVPPPVVIPPPVIGTVTLPVGTVNQPYVAGLSGSAGTRPYWWSVASGLPPGLSILHGYSSISGTPTIAGTYTFILTLQDSTTPTPTIVTKTLSITIVDPAQPTPPPPVISVTSFNNGAVGVPYSAALTGINGTAPYSWSVASVLPPGLSVVGAAITGTPTTAGGYGFVLTLTDSASPTPVVVTKSLSITVDGPPAPPPTPTVANTVQSVVAVLRSDGRWNLVVTDLPPDGSGGWSVQYYRNPGIVLGTVDARTPFTRSVIVRAGTYSVSATWRKRNVASVTRDALVVVVA